MMGMLDKDPKVYLTCGCGAMEHTVRALIFEDVGEVELWMQIGVPPSQGMWQRLKFCWAILRGKNYTIDGCGTLISRADAKILREFLDDYENRCARGELPAWLRDGEDPIP